MQREAIESMEFADEVPLVDDLLTAWDGTIWVRRPPTSDFSFDLSANPGGHNLQRALQTNQMNRPPAPIDLLTPDGQYLGTIPATQARWARRDRTGRAGGLHRGQRAGGPHRPGRTGIRVAVRKSVTRLREDGGVLFVRRM